MAEEKRNLPKPPLPGGLGGGLPKPPVGGQKPLPPPGGAAGPGQFPGPPKGIPPQKPLPGMQRPAGQPRIPSAEATIADDTRDLDLTRRIHDMERKSDEIAENKDLFENQIKELETKLQEEKEKVLLASLRSKEEAALATKVELALKEMQERLRKDRQTQELDESRKKAEDRVKELERKLVEERETWMQTLKDQLEQKDVQDRDIEEYLSQRVGELEERWQEEKDGIISQLKEKEETIIKQQQEYLLEEEELKKRYEDDIHELSSKINEQDRGFQESFRRSSEEKQILTAQLEEDEKTLIHVRTQMSLIQSQSKLEKDKIFSEWQRRLEDEERNQQALVTKNISLQEGIDALQRKMEEMVASSHGQINDSRNQVEIVRQEFEKNRDEFVNKHNEERELWRKSVLEFETKIVREKENWNRELESYKRAWLRERESLLHEREKLIRDISRTDELLKKQKEELEKKANEEKTRFIIDTSASGKKWHQKEDDYKRLISQKENDYNDLVSQKESESKFLEERYLSEREALSEALGAREKELREITDKFTDSQITFNSRSEKFENDFKDLETKYWNEKESALRLLRGKEEEIARLKSEISTKELDLREKMDLDYRVLAEKMESENKGWKNSLMVQFEEESSAKINLMQQELKSLRDSIESELSVVETKVTEESLIWQNKIKDKENELAVVKTELNGVLQEKPHRESIYNDASRENKELRGRIENLQQTLNYKEKELERFHTEILQSEMQKLRNETETRLQQERGRWENAIQEKERDLLEIKRRFERAEESKKREIEELSSRFQEEISILEARFQKQVDEGNVNLVRKVWRYLNRTVVIVNFRPFSGSKRRK